MHIPRAILLALLTLLVCEATAPAQSPSERAALSALRNNRYAEATDALLGTRTTPDHLSAGAREVLGEAYARRAYLLRDLADFQVRVGRDYHVDRDTNRTATRAPLNTYFLGRYLFESGQLGPAQAALGRAAGNTRLDADVRTRARMWTGAAEALQGHAAEARAAWTGLPSSGPLAVELDFVQWRVGMPRPPSAMPDPGTGTSVAALRARLWAAARTRRLETLPALQRRLLGEPAVEAEHRVDARFSLRFYDPLTIQLLAYADLMAAEAAFAADGAPHRMAFKAGVAAFEAAEFARARTHFERATRFEARDRKQQAEREAYLGALDYLAGRREQAEARWERLLADHPEAAYAWFDVSTQVTGRRPTRQQQQVLRRVMDALATPEGPRTIDLEAAWHMGRGLVRTGRFEEAVAVMSAVYPTDKSNDTRFIPPSYLVVLAHAKYALGRTHYPEVRSHLAALADAYAFAEPAHELAVSITAPRRFKGGKSRPG